MRPKMGRMMHDITSLLTRTKKTSPGFWLRPTAATPSSRAQSSISFRLQCCCNAQHAVMGPKPYIDP